MTKAGEQILEGMNEAVAIAKGDQPAARLWIKGHAYVPEAELDMLTKAGIVEVAIRNPSVAEYMRHWEGRAEKAEAALTQAVETEREECAALADDGVPLRGDSDYSSGASDMAYEIAAAIRARGSNADK